MATYEFPKTDQPDVFLFCKKKTSKKLFSIMLEDIQERASLQRNLRTFQRFQEKPKASRPLEATTRYGNDAMSQYFIY